MAKKTYSEKLKDPRWQRKLLEILQRDKWQCILCGCADKTLHVHHGYYEKHASPWEYDSRSLHTVCEECHEQADNIRQALHSLIGKLPIDLQLELVLFIDDIAKLGSLEAGRILRCATTAFKFEQPQTQHEVVLEVRNTEYVTVTK